MEIQSTKTTFITIMSQKSTSHQIHYMNPRRKSTYTTTARRFIDGDGRRSNQGRTREDPAVEAFLCLPEFPEELEEDEESSRIIDNFEPLSEDEIRNLLNKTMSMAAEGDPQRILNICKKLRKIMRFDAVDYLKRLMELEPIWKRDEV